MQSQSSHFNVAEYFKNWMQNFVCNRFDMNKVLLFCVAVHGKCQIQRPMFVLLGKLDDMFYRLQVEILNWAWFRYFDADFGLKGRKQHDFVRCLSHNVCYFIINRVR